MSVRCKNIIHWVWVIKNKLVNSMRRYMFIKKRAKQLKELGACVECKIKKVTPSNLKIDIIIPSIKKDFVVLPYTIASARKNIKHPIVNIYVVSPDSEEIKTFCAEKNCIFVDENRVLPITKKDIEYNVNGLDRSGWLFQQFLKWSGDEFCSQEYYLVLDSDTIFVTPRVFEKQGKIIFNFSDEYHKPYFDIYERLLNIKANCPVSFTSHHMLFQVTRIKELKRLIEKKFSMKWHEAILFLLNKNQVSGCSDYETYGQFMFLKYRNDILIEYWHNLSLKRDLIRDVSLLSKKFAGKYKTISFHSWNT